MQQSRLEELARQSPQLNDGVRRMLTVEFTTGWAYYRLEEVYDELEGDMFLVPPSIARVYAKRRSTESIGNDYTYCPSVESLEFGALRANKPSPHLKSVLIEPLMGAANVYGVPFSLHYIDSSLVDAMFKAHPKKYNAGVRVIPPRQGKPVRIEIVQFISHSIDVEDLTTENCVTSETQGKEVVLPFSWNYEGSTICVEENGGSFHVTVAEPEFRFPREVSFPVNLDARCNAFFELGNTDWLFANQLFRISVHGGF